MRENAAVGKDTTIAAAVETALEAGYFGELAYMNGKGNRTRMGAGSMVSRCKEAMGRWKDVPLNKELLMDPRHTPVSLAEGYIKWITAASQGFAHGLQ